MVSRQAAACGEQAGGQAGRCTAADDRWQEGEVCLCPSAPAQTAPLLLPTDHRPPACQPVLYRTLVCCTYCPHLPAASTFLHPTHRSCCCPQIPPLPAAAFVSKRTKELQDREGYLKNMWYAAGERGWVGL